MIAQLTISRSLSRTEVPELPRSSDARAVHSVHVSPTPLTPNQLAVVYNFNAHLLKGLCSRQGIFTLQESQVILSFAFRNCAQHQGPMRDGFISGHGDSDHERTPPGLIRNLEPLFELMLICYPIKTDNYSLEIADLFLESENLISGIVWHV